MIPSLETRARIALVALSVLFALMAVGLYAVRAQEILWPDLWPWYFGACAVTTGLLGVLMRRWIYFLSGCLVPVGCFLRVVAIYEKIHHGNNQGSVILGLGVFGALALLTALVWVYMLGPLISYRRSTGHGARGIE